LTQLNVLLHAADTDDIATETATSLGKASLMPFGTLCCF